MAYQKLASWDHPKWVKIYAQRKKKFSVNNGQLLLELPPRVAHASFSKMGVKFKVNLSTILQGLGVGPGSATEC